jgi:hypothetical protein
MRTSLFALLAIFALQASALASGTETYVGIGITIQKSHDSFQIVDLIANGPAATAGVNLNDWLKTVDQKPTDKLKIDDVVKMLAGDAGTAVALGLEDDKTHASREVKVTRAEITIQCFLEGNINLNFMGSSPQSGTISGFIGQDSIFLNAFGTQVSGNVNGEYINLMLQNTGGIGMTISGYIHSTYVTWQSSGTGTFFGYQDCVQ